MIFRNACFDRERLAPYRHEIECLRIDLAERIECIKQQAERIAGLEEHNIQLMRKCEDDSMALTAAYMSGAHAGRKNAEAELAKVREWARRRCECCAHHPKATCGECQNMGNWTPAWAKGE